MAQQIVTLAEDPQPPYVNVTDGKITGGIAVQIVQKIFDKLPEVDVNFELMPWKRALVEAKYGRTDGIIFVSKNQEREEYLAYSDAIFEGRAVFFYRKPPMSKRFNWHTLSDLAPYTIVAIRGQGILKILQTRAKDANLALNIHVVNNEETAMSMLQLGRVDLALFNEIVGKTMVNNNDDYFYIVAADKVFAARTYHMALSKKSKARELMPRINDIILELKSNGEIDQILDF